MARSIDPRDTFEFILKADRSLEDTDPNKTVWILRALTPAEEARLQDQVAFSSSDGGQIGYRSGSVLLDTLRLGVVGWRNFRDADGDEIEVRRKKVGSVNGNRDELHDDCIARIHPDDRRELSNAITAGGRLTEEEVGKS